MDNKIVKVASILITMGVFLDAAAETRFVPYKNYMIPMVIIKPPQSVTATVETDSDGTISWSAAVEAEHYQLERYNEATGQWETVYTGTALTYQVPDLSINAHQYRVRSCNQNICGPGSMVALANPAQMIGYPRNSTQCSARNFNE